MGQAFCQQKIYSFDRRTVTSDNSERRGHLEWGCCWCQSVFQLGKFREFITFEINRANARKRRAVHGRFMGIEDKFNRGFRMLRKQFEKVTEKVENCLDRLGCHACCTQCLSGRRNFPKSQTTRAAPMHCSEN